MNWQEFLQVKEVKHRADLTSGDVLLLAVNEGGIPHEELAFERAVCDGYCGREEFVGYWEETGKRVGWLNTSYFKIIGSSIITRPCPVRQGRNEYANSELYNKD